ncbi:protein kinase [Streptacidiphilus sp. EB129]|uniref:serine/threonine-protein kinase n=1 Tax=Streptacidiphilus sp. EB129 TaxID=3156262 RepID=UPI003518FCB5
MDDTIGRGGMGEVWRAWDEVLGRPVAVKLLLPGVGDPLAAARFRQEAQTAARLSHPHVVSVYDFGEDLGRLYLVMELVEGRTLADHLTARGALSPAEVADIGAQAAAGLAAAHREGVVHRDVKPGNLLLATDGVVKVADFGIARFADETTSALTSAGMVLGTSIYLAPERALGRPAGPSSDVYALGCVLYELLVGRPPFQADTAPGLLFQHVEAVPTAPAELRGGLPAGFSDRLMRLLAKDPDHRPSADQVAQWLRGQQPAADGRALGRTAAQPSVGVDGRGERAPDPSRRRSRLMVGAGATVVGGALAVALGMALMPAGNRAAASSRGHAPASMAAHTPDYQPSFTTAPAPTHEPSRTPAPAATNPAVLLGQLSRALRTAAGAGQLAAPVDAAVQKTIAQAQAAQAQGKAAVVRGLVHTIDVQLAAARQHHQFTPTPALDQLLSHLTAHA